MNALETRRVIWGLQKHTDLAGVVWDRAPRHIDKTVRQLGMPWVSLPPYIPELNPAERVFEELRRAVEGVVYAFLDDKVAAITKTLRELDADPARVRSLAGLDWINDALEAPPADYAA